MLLAGDVGGTKTLLGLFDAASPRPRPVATREYATLDYADLPAIIARFLNDAAVTDGAVGSALLRRRRPDGRRSRAADQRAVDRRRAPDRVALRIRGVSC